METLLQELSVKPKNEQPPRGQHPPDHDTDGDGIADTWERTNGLVVGVSPLG